MWVKGKIIRFGTVTLKESCKRLPGIHHTEIAGIVYQFLISVGRWCSRSDKSVRDTGKQWKELLISLRAITT